jgi:hypothetical protein
MVVVADGAARETSKAAEPDVGARGTQLHRECYARGRGEDPSLGSDALV